MSANDEKRYYWIKLDKDYFYRHDVMIIENIKNGIDGRIISLFLLKLCAESTSHNGYLRFSKDIPYDVEMLASITRYSFEETKKCLEILEKYKLVEIVKDESYYIPQVERMTGSETGQTKRKREAKEGNSVVENTNEIPSYEVKDTLESRVKSIEYRDKILDYLSSSKLIYKELDMLDKFNDIQSMMIKAYELTNKCPSQDKLINLCNYLVNNQSIYNMQGYIIDCFKNEGE